MKIHSIFSCFLQRFCLVLPFFLGVQLLLIPHAGHAADGDFAWAKSIGGSVADQGNSIYVDSSGNVYVTGFFEGTVDFDPGPGTVNLTSPGTTNIFIAKFDSSGNLVWAKSIGGNIYDDAGFGIYADPAGNVYTTGYFQGVNIDFDPGPGTYPLTSDGSTGIFISKLDSNGDFVWARMMGGNFFDYGYGIFVDGTGNVYTTGYFQGTVDFDPGAGTYNLVSQGTTDDVFISKLDSNGNFSWARRIGGDAADVGLGISLFSGGYVYTTGYFQGTVDFNPGGGVYNLTSSNNSNDIFVSKLNSSGNFVWARAMGGAGGDMGNSIALDQGGNVYTTGSFIGTADFDPGVGTYELTSDSPASDIFISKLNSNGNFVWAKRIGGTTADVGYGISVNSSGNVFTTGYFGSTVDFDPADGTTYELTIPSGSGIFISKLNNNGNFVWAKGLGGSVGLGDTGNAIFADQYGNVHTTGYFQGENIDFDPGNGVYNLSSNGFSDIFIGKLAGTDTPPFPWLMFLPAINNNAQP